MKELMQSFEGKGEVRGFKFRQVARTHSGYLYMVSQPYVVTPHFEVFRRRENHRFGVVSYPRATAFGRWAWTCLDIEAAQKKLSEISQTNHNTSL